MGWSPQNPNGYLGKIDLVGCKGSAPGLFVRPATLDQASTDNDRLDLAGFVGVGETKSKSVGTTPFKHTISKNITCAGGASATLSGSVDLSVKPSLQASFGFLKVSSASFKVKGSADASLKLEGHAGEACSLADLPLVKNAPIATFEGQVGPLPVVVSLQGEVMLGAGVEASLDASASLGAHASVTGGISYAGGRASPILGSSASIDKSQPTVTGSGHAYAHLKPAIQALLYGVAGPKLTLTTGLDLNAATNLNPWWTLTAPLYIDASLAAPALGIKTDPLPIYTHDPFPIAAAAGAFPGTTGTTEPTAGGTPQELSGPVGPPSLISAGPSQTCALSAGAPLCWGDNGAGQLGNGTSTVPDPCHQPTNGASCSATPVSVSGVGPVTEVTSGRYGSCGLQSGGTVKCWGSFFGNGSYTSKSVPVTIGGIGTAIQISWRNSHICVLLRDQTISCWGENNVGQLGDGTRTLRSAPVTVPGIHNAVQVTTGDSHTCALVASGAVYCWGDDSGIGSLGTGAYIDRSLVPVKVRDLESAVYISSGVGSSCAVMANHRIECWGFNDFGQLGDGTDINRNAPVTVSGIDNATQVSTGGSSTCALLTTGSVECWGDNANGELGDGINNAWRWLPAPVFGVTDATQVSVGYGQACALHRGGGASCWGSNSSGELGTNSPADAVRLPGAVVGLP